MRILVFRYIRVRDAAKSCCKLWMFLRKPIRPEKKRCTWSVRRLVNHVTEDMTSHLRKHQLSQSQPKETKKKLTYYYDWQSSQWSSVKWQDFTFLLQEFQPTVLNFERTVIKQLGAREKANLLTIQKLGASRKLIERTPVCHVALRFGSARVWVQKGGSGDTYETNAYSQQH
jgi:hypothetical protein